MIGLTQNFLPAPLAPLPLYVFSNCFNFKFQNTGTNEVSGTSEFLPLEPPVRDTGASKSSLERNYAKLRFFQIFQGRDLGDGLK